MSSSIYDEMTFSEKMVADFLSENSLYWNFEHPVYVADDKDRPRVWCPDFYLPELGVYIEVCGVERKNYEFRKKIYLKNKIPVVFVQTYKDDDKWQNYLIEEIKRIFDKRMESIEHIYLD